MEKMFRFLRAQGRESGDGIESKDGLEEEKRESAGQQLEEVRAEGNGSQLETLEVFVGDYEERFQYEMIGPKQEILAWYKCIAVDGKDGAQEERCDGEATQNYYYG